MNETDIIRVITVAGSDSTPATTPRIPTTTSIQVTASICSSDDSEYAAICDIEHSISARTNGAPGRLQQVKRRQLTIVSYETRLIRVNP